MDHQVRVFGVLDEPLIRPRVAPEHETQPIPLEPVADGTIEAVDGRPTLDRDAALFIDDLVFLLVVELVGDDFSARIGKQTGSAFDVSGESFDEGIHRCLRA